MPFTHPVPDWNAQGAEPPESLKTTGWAINQRPPADYFNWFFYNTAKAIIELQLEAINTDQKGVANGLATLGADGKLTASQLPATPLVTTSSNGLMSSADKTKLDGIEANANNYTHPSTHPATMITEDSDHRFATDGEKIRWNGAYDTIGDHTADGSIHLGSSEKIAVTELQNVSDSGWTTATLLNGWTTKFDRTVRFRRVGNMLHISGGVGGGTTGDGTSVFVLPTGYRPSRTVIAPIIAAGTGAILNNNALINRMVVTTGGNVTFSYGWNPEGWAIDVIIPL